jgi:hypothetical protein
MCIIYLKLLLQSHLQINMITYNYKSIKNV